MPNPTLIQTVGLAIAALAIGGCSQQKPTHILKQDGDFHFEQGEYEAAANEFQEVVDRNPGDWYGQYMLGRARTELNQPDEARVALEQAHALQPLNDDVADALAEAMFEAGDHNELFAFLRGRADERRSTKSYLDLARYAIALDDMDSADVALLTAIEVDGGRTVEPYLMRAEYAERIGNTEETVHRLRQAYGINPRHAVVMARLREYGEDPNSFTPPPPGR
jgi:tetratricopeptide (TPR) repeat protein